MKKVLATDYKPQQSRSVLDAWIMEEMLSPSTIPSETNLNPIESNGSKEPWDAGRSCKKDAKASVRWKVYLCQIDVRNAMKRMLEKFPDEYTDKKPEADKGKAAAFAMGLDGQGCPLPDSMFLSGFAWGYGKVLSGKMDNLASFEDESHLILEEMRRFVPKQDESGEALPFRYSDVAETENWLINKLGIPSDDVLGASYAEAFPSSTGKSSRVELFNSFYAEDLMTVKKEVRGRNVGKALSLYMGTVRPGYQVDINKDREILSQISSPERIPLAKWPGKGNHPLCLMQQAAVNHVTDSLGESGIVAVNGPPGTGKTTLLRNILAKVVLDRAVAMSKFDSPSNAFLPPEHIVFKNRSRPVHALRGSLLGHEMVIASSNNKAVENISKEIPSLSAVSDEAAQSLDYFRAISDIVASENDSTWGLAAAVLGAKDNRSAFVERFWEDKEHGMSVYLEAIAGDGTAKVEAQKRWKAAREEFKAKYLEAERLRNTAQKVYRAMIDEETCCQRYGRAKTEQEEAMAALPHMQKSLDEITMLHERKNSEYLNAKTNNETMIALKPGFFAKLFNLPVYRHWRSRSMELSEALDRLQDEVREVDAKRREAEDLCKEAETRLAGTKSVAEKTKEEWFAIKTKLKYGHEKMGRSFMDVRSAKDEKDLQQSSPWLFDEFQQARNALFVCAFELHRAFIDAAAEELKDNLSVVSAMLKGTGVREIGRSLWASLFLVVPAVSTTLASFPKMFAGLGKEELGWLLIDEAGQTTPQSAVGAIWRSKRAVVIGDPFQIEPIAEISKRLSESIFGSFGLSYVEWSATETSVQGISDRVSKVGTSLDHENGTGWIGLPLTVHRRCEDPMFSISNNIAYANRMVYATAEGDSRIRDVLGKSRWIDVKEYCADKWSEREGDEVLQMLKSIKSAGIKNPDVFFISPFRNVVSKLREAITKDGVLAGLVPGTPHDWIQNRVGTIHTFQGKEAETVVIVLGASDDASSGARNWAGSTPNLLNVAVTRAKRSLYVIGDRDVWKRVGFFGVLSDMLPDDVLSVDENRYDIATIACVRDV
jgi:hypothetical protein